MKNLVKFFKKLERFLMTLDLPESEKIKIIEDAMSGTMSHWCTLEAEVVTSWVEFQQRFLDEFWFPGIREIPHPTSWFEI